MSLKIKYNTYDPRTGEFDCHEGEMNEDGGVHALAVFRGSEFTDEDLEELNDCRIDNYYGGPGRRFCHGWYWNRHGSRVVAKCYSGLDI